MSFAQTVRHSAFAEVLRHLVAASALATVTLASEASAQAQRATRPSQTVMRVAVFDSRTVLDSMPERSLAESEFALEQAKARTLLGAACSCGRATTSCSTARTIR